MTERRPLVLINGEMQELPTGDSLPGGGGGGSWAQIATTTASGATVTFADIPQTYQDLMVVFDQVSHNNGANAAIKVTISADGTNFDGVTTYITDTASATQGWAGLLFIPGYTLGAGGMLIAINNLNNNSPRTGLQNTPRLIAWRSTTGLRGLRFQMDAGSFDAGSISLYGR